MPLHPRRAAQDCAVQHDKNTQSQHERLVREDAPIITEVQIDAAPSSVDANPIVEDVVLEEIVFEPADKISKKALLAARWQAVEEQQAVNNTAREEYLQFDRVQIAFNGAGNREVESLRNEDLRVFMDSRNLMTNLAVKSVLW